MPCDPLSDREIHAGIRKSPRRSSELSETRLIPALACRFSARSQASERETPKPIRHRQPLKTVFKELKQKLLRKAVQYVGRATLAEGILKGTQLPFRCLIVGGEAFSGYLLVRIFGESLKILKRRRIWIPSIKRLAKNPSSDLDLIIAILPHSYRARFRGVYDFCGPQNVKQVVDITGSWEEVRKQFHRTKRHLVNRLEASQEFNFRISNDPKDLELFSTECSCRTRRGSSETMPSSNRMKQ